MLAVSRQAVVGRFLARAFDAWDRPPAARVRAAVSLWGLALVFVAITVERTISAYRLGYIAVDLRIYRAAAAAALQGGDPWRAGAEGLTFAAPPPALIPYLPAALVPEGVAIAVYGGLSVLAAVMAIRAVGLPLWWLLFPPLAECIVVLNSDVFVIALLLCARRWAFAAIVFKLYAAVPLLIQGRWAAIAIGGLVCAASLPLLPQFIADRELIGEALDVQASGGLSAWGTWLMVPTIAALVILRHRGAEWLAVPALWPFTQLHYSVLGLPVAARSPLTAFLLCFSVLYLPPIAVIILATEVIARRAAALYRPGATNIAPSSSA
jgi:hypothetical protein